MTEEHMGYICEREYTLWTASDLSAHFGCRAENLAHLGLTFSTFVDETGSPLEAIAVADPNAKRKLKVYSCIGLKLNEWLHKGESQLRPQQGSELRRVYRQDMRNCNETPKILFSKAVVTMEEITTTVNQRKEELEAQRVEQERMAQLAAAAMATKEPIVKEESTKAVEAPSRMLSGSSSSDDEGMGQPVLLPSQRAKLAKERKKQQKGSGKSAGKPQKPPLPAKLAKGGKSVLEKAKPSCARPSVSMAAAGDGASVASGSSSRLGRPKDKAGSKMQACDLTRILAGDAMADKSYNLKRTIESLEEQAELNALKHHLELANLAKETGSS